MQSTDQTLLATVATLSGYCEPTIVIVIFFYWHFKSAVIWSAENIFLWEGKGNYEGRLKFTYILYSLGQRTFYIIICEKSGYLETDIFHEHVHVHFLVDYKWSLCFIQFRFRKLNLARKTKWIMSEPEVTPIQDLFTHLLLGLECNGKY